MPLKKNDAHNRTIRYVALHIKHAVSAMKPIHSLILTSYGHLRLGTCGLAFLITGCVKPPPPPVIAKPAVMDELVIPVPQDKPKIQTSKEDAQEQKRGIQKKQANFNNARWDFLVNLYQSHIFLTSFNYDQADDSLSESALLLSRAEMPSAAQSALLAEITFVHHGTLSRLYIPMSRGKDRYKEISRSIALLKAKKLDTVDYKLVTYSFPQNDPNAINIIKKAREMINDSSIKDESYAFLTADRELSKFSTILMNIKPYEGLALNRFGLHYLSARLFFDQNNYEIARIALQQAEDALAQYKQEQNKDKQYNQYLKDYELRLEQLKRAINDKDPTLLGKLDDWWNRLSSEE